MTRAIFAAACVGAVLIACGSDEQNFDGLPPAPTGMPPLPAVSDAGAAPAAEPAAFDGGGFSGPASSPEDAGVSAVNPCGLSAQACDLTNDCGCDPGTTCAVAATLSRYCRLITPEPAAAYAACGYDYNCPAGHSCIGKACRKHCATKADCGWPGAACLPVLDGDSNPIEGFNFCARNCDLLSPAQPRAGFQPCGYGTTCYVYDFPFVPDCTGYVGSGTAGEPCDATYSCAPGHYCDETEHCQRNCELGGDTCGAGSACMAFNPAVTIAGAEIGSCVCRPSSGEACDPVTDCGCRASETCSFAGPPYTPACIPRAEVPAAPYTACADDVECPALHACIGGLCKRECNTASDCGWIGAECLPVRSDEGPLPNRGFCSRYCDPAAPELGSGDFQGCQPGNNCYLIGESTFDCLPIIGSGLTGSSCESSFDCLPSLFCSGAGRCEQWCHVGGSECGRELGCVPFSPVLSSGGVEWGSCRCVPDEPGTESTNGVCSPPPPDLPPPDAGPAPSPAPDAGPAPSPATDAGL